MKNLIIVVSCLLFTPSAFAELTVQDLDKIRSILKEEIKDEVRPIETKIASIETKIESIETKIESIETKIESIETKIASTREDVASLSGRVEGVEKQITWLMGVILVVVGIPQVIMVWQGRKNREQEKRLEALAQEIETLKQQIANP